MNTPVSFLLAKLLKENGYPQFAEYLGTSIPNTPKCYADSFGNLYDRSDWEDNPEFYLKEISAPTIAEVVMWLYEKHGIWIIAVPQGLSTTWVFSLFNTEPEKGRIIFDSPSFNSPTEAYEAAILYTLNNLL